AMKVARTVRIGGKVGDKLKDLPIDNKIKQCLIRALFTLFHLKESTFLVILNELTHALVA
ncbi:hypothetical protein FNE59_00985, partial [Bacillus thuringiensis]|uniref:hypothetical protein n=1 Tax=Bacillus thuringiensis TaxID=1428 RepID=UPI002853FF12|nr:hypothetical protein [Bacillus thuringiensis]